MGGRIISEKIYVDRFEKSNGGDCFYFMSKVALNAFKILENWKYPIYSSNTNLTLLRLMYNVDVNLLKPLPFNKPTKLTRTDFEFTVTLIDSNSYTGRIIYHFSHNDIESLYVDGSLMSPNILNNPYLLYLGNAKKIDILYIDTQLLHMATEISVTHACNQIIQYMQLHSDKLAVIAMPSLGMEDIIVHTARKGYKIYVGRGRIKFFELLGVTANITNDLKDASLRVVDSQKCMDVDYCYKHFISKNIITLVPSPIYSLKQISILKKIGVHIVHYADYTTPGILVDFLRFIRPKNLLACDEAIPKQSVLNKLLLYSRSNLSLNSTLLSTSINQQLSCLSLNGSLEIANTLDKNSQPNSNIAHLFTDTQGSFVPLATSTQKCTQNYDNYSVMFDGNDKENINKSNNILKEMDLSLNSPLCQNEVQDENVETDKNQNKKILHKNSVKGKPNEVLISIVEETEETSNAEGGNEMNIILGACPVDEFPSQKLPLSQRDLQENVYSNNSFENNPLSQKSVQEHYIDQSNIGTKCPNLENNTSNYNKFNEYNIGNSEGDSEESYFSKLSDIDDSMVTVQNEEQTNVEEEPDLNENVGGNTVSPSKKLKQVHFDSAYDQVHMFESDDEIIPSTSSSEQDKNDRVPDYGSINENIFSELEMEERCSRLVQDEEQVSSSDSAGTSMDFSFSSIMKPCHVRLERLSDFNKPIVLSKKQQKLKQKNNKICTQLMGLPVPNLNSNPCIASPRLLEHFAINCIDSTDMTISLNKFSFHTNLKGRKKES